MLNILKIHHVEIFPTQVYVTIIAILFLIVLTALSIKRRDRINELGFYWGISNIIGVLLILYGCLNVAIIAMAL